MRRPRARFAASHPGGAGAPPGGTRTSCEELADARVRGPWGKARPGVAKNRRDGAPRGARVLQKGMRQDGRLVRHSVLHPLDFFEGAEKAPHSGAGDDGLPGAVKNAGDDACPPRPYTPDQIPFDFVTLISIMDDQNGI